jgi:predicted DNA-binding transcriptional regulator YafY
MLFKLRQRLSYLNQLIKQRATGSPKELARKLGITERVWYKFRDELVNDLNLPIDYCPHSRSYIYTEEGSFEIGFKKLPPDKAANLTGGKAVLATFIHFLW